MANCFGNKIKNFKRFYKVIIRCVTGTGILFRIRFQVAIRTSVKQSIDSTVMFDEYLSLKRIEG